VCGRGPALRGGGGGHANARQSEGEGISGTVITAAGPGRVQWWRINHGGEAYVSTRAGGGARGQARGVDALLVFLIE
jgi:hypothetical protein